MKKLYKLLGVAGVVGAAVGGYLYFKDRIEADSQDFEDDDDVDAAAESAEKKSEYISLDTSEEDAAEAEIQAKRTLKETVKSVTLDMKQKAEEAAKGVGVVRDEIKKTASDFAFKAFDKNDEQEAEEEVAQAEEPAEEAKAVAPSEIDE